VLSFLLPAEGSDGHGNGKKGQAQDEEATSNMEEEDEREDNIEGLEAQKTQK
jgi:hypothetical protein